MVLNEGYFFLSFADLIGMIVTLFSALLIIKQLRDSRLAVQMEGFLTIIDRFAAITQAIAFVDSLYLSEEWKLFDGQEAYRFIMENEDNKEFYLQVGIFYEGVSALLRRGALDKGLAIDTFGGVGVTRFKTLEKAIKFHRKHVGEPDLYNQWEWLALNLDSL